MNYPWLEAYCVQKEGALKHEQPAWAATQYLLGGKMFALCGHNAAGQAIITLKLLPEEGDYLRQQYPEAITAGYYMNKVHWNSVLLTGGVPDALLQDMIDKSYAIIRKSLPKKTQQALAEAALKG